MGPIEQHLQLLGTHMKDIVTGIEGMVDSISFDVYGCVQGCLRTVANKDGTLPESRWYDVKRLKPTSKKRLLDVPAFIEMPIGTEAGPADKPIP